MIGIPDSEPQRQPQPRAPRSHQRPTNDCAGTSCQNSSCCKVRLIITAAMAFVKDACLSVVTQFNFADSAREHSPPRKSKRPIFKLSHYLCLSLCGFLHECIVGAYGRNLGL